MKIFKPILRDIDSIQKLLQPFVDENIILFRDKSEIAMNIHSYNAISINNELVAISALHIYSENLAEVRSLAVSEQYQKNGLGRELIKIIEKEAKELGIKKLLTLTYKSGFFSKLGFIEIPKESVPEQKVWLDCIKCKHFPNCNEIAMIKNI